MTNNKFNLIVNTMETPSTRSISSSPLPRLLCLHGQGSNSIVTAAQIRNLGLDESFDVTYLLAPWQWSGEVDESVESTSPNGPFHSWMRKKKSMSDLITSMRFVLQHIIKQGPYDAVYGFSQGAGIATLLSCDEIRKKLIQDLVDRDNHEVTEMDIPWRFIFATCATFPVTLQDIANYFDVKAISLSISIPSAHLIGIQDPFKGRSEQLFDVLRGGYNNLSLAVYFEGGHEISSDSRSLKKAAYAAIDWFSKYNFDRLPPLVHNGSERSLLREITEEIDDFAKRQSSIGGRFAQCINWQYQLNTIADIDNDLNLAALMKRQEIENHVAFRASGKKPITYGTLWKFVRDEGNLSTVGCKCGDKVAYLAPYGVVGAVAFISIALQCQAIPLDPESSSSNLDDAFRQLCPDVFVIFDDLGADVCKQAEVSAAMLDIRVIHASGSKKESPFVFLDREVRDPAENCFFENTGNDTCLLLRTSGTTSQPKVSAGSNIPIRLCIRIVPRDLPPPSVESLADHFFASPVSSQFCIDIIFVYYCAF